MATTIIIINKLKRDLDIITRLIKLEEQGDK